VPGLGADDAALGNAQRRTNLVRIPSDLAADLALLTDALDVPDTDIAATLAALMSDAAAAVSSYVGLSVRVCSRHSHVELTTLESSQRSSITTSLRIPLQTEAALQADTARFVLILYAATAGALVDLAADLTWLTGRSTDELCLDDDIAGKFHLHPPESLRSQSAINQAIGALIGQGRTPDQARMELDVRAADSGMKVHAAAVGLLASLPTAILPSDE
jgi:hypothetical protein